MSYEGVKSYILESVGSQVIFFVPQAQDFPEKKNETFFLLFQTPLSLEGFQRKMEEVYGITLVKPQKKHSQLKPEWFFSARKEMRSELIWSWAFSARYLEPKIKSKKKFCTSKGIVLKKEKTLTTKTQINSTNNSIGRQEGDAGPSWRRALEGPDRVLLLLLPSLHGRGAVLPGRAQEHIQFPNTKNRDGRVQRRGL